VAIVGSGFSGMGVAIKLREAGVDDFVILERGSDFGGTWRDNTYPGAACDVPSLLYSFSFAPNPEWSHAFSPQPEIFSYLQRCGRRYGLYRFARFNHEVRGAAWDEASRVWRIDTSQGQYEARVMVSAVGPLSEPSLPDIPGIETFAGKLFHSARWDHDHDLTGERVAVIGTGASSIQFVPQIADKVSQLHVFQRTAPWIIARSERRLSAAEHKAYQLFPFVQKAVRAGIYWSRELYVVGFAKNPKLMKLAERISRRHLRKQVADRELRSKLTPTYTMGCKRILISNNYYPAVSRPNVDVVTDKIVEIRPHSVVTADGTERPVDTLILGTGFHVTDMPMAQWVTGRDGVLLADAWKDGVQAYKGTTVNGFPNMFIMIGPNTGLGHNSMVYMIESQLNYVLDAIKYLGRPGVSDVDVDPGAESEFNVDIQKMLQGTVWTAGGCVSWYLDENGRNTTVWPTFTAAFRQQTRRFDVDKYEVRKAPALV
jgi:cation diffusion facilitator CzcD-associated flavoprotein CzcO